MKYSSALISCFLLRGPLTSLQIKCCKCKHLLMGVFLKLRENIRDSLLAFASCSSHLKFCLRCLKYVFSAKNHTQFQMQKQYPETGKMNHDLPGKKGLKESVMTTMKQFSVAMFQGDTDG